MAFPSFAEGIGAGANGRQHAAIGSACLFGACGCPHRLSPAVSAGEVGVRIGPPLGHRRPGHSRDEVVGRAGEVRPELGEARDLISLEVSFAVSPAQS